VGGCESTLEINGSARDRGDTNRGAATDPNSDWMAFSGLEDPNHHGMTDQVQITA
jgi:hypothetical protein